MFKFLNLDVDTIFLMLGPKCNFRCKYCMQIPEGAHTFELPTEINYEIFDFIKELGRKVTIQFYGGEPLMYFDKIKEVVENTKDLGVKYSTITNGSLLTDEIVEFLVDNNFHTGVSYDGSGTVHTRTKDVMADEALRKRILSLPRLCFSAVLNSHVYPKQLCDDIQQIDNEYQKIHNCHLSFNADELFDTGCADRGLFDIDYDRVADEVREIYADGIAMMKDEFDVSKEEFDTKHAMRRQFFDKIYNQVKNYVNTVNLLGYGEHGLSPCGGGLKVLNMDLAGNMYSCHNQYDKVGSIYTPLSTVIDRLAFFDNVSRNYETCRDCRAYPICRGGCKLMTAKTREETYCKLKKAVYVPLIELLEAI